jgi:hypothetical protein
MNIIPCTHAPSSPHSYWHNDAIYFLRLESSLEVRNGRASILTGSELPIYQHMNIIPYTHVPFDTGTIMKLLFLLLKSSLEVRNGVPSWGSA